MRRLTKVRLSFAAIRLENKMQAKVKSTGSVKPLGIVLLVAGLLWSFAATTTASPLTLTVTLTETVADPFGIYKECNVFVLKGMKANEPQVAAVFYDTGPTNVYSAQVAFYDSWLNLMDTWTIPDPSQSNPDMVMLVTSGDLNGDGKNEIALVGRQRSAGVYVTQWNGQSQHIENLWNYPLGTIPSSEYARGVAVGKFVPDSVSPGKQVAFGGTPASSLFYVLNNGGGLLSQGVAGFGNRVVQHIEAVDLDSDGLDEMLLSTGRDGGRVTAYEYNQVTNQWGVSWSVNATSGKNVGNDVYGVSYHPTGGPTGGPAVAFATESESLTELHGSVGLLDLTHFDSQGRPVILWQQAYPENARPSSVDFADITGDGVPELMARMSFLDHTQKLAIYDNRGNLIAAPVVDLAETMTPYVFDYGNDGKMDILFSGAPGVFNVYRVVEVPEPPAWIYLATIACVVGKWIVSKGRSKGR